MPANCVFGVMTVSEWGVAATLGTYLAAGWGPKSLWPRFILALPVMLRCPTRHWGLRRISAMRFLGDENMAAQAKSATQMGNSSGNTHNRIQI
jgi:hypothetical protein